MVSGVWVSVKLLEGNLKRVKDDYPHLITNHTTVARKMGFPEVIMPCKLLLVNQSPGGAGYLV